MTAPPGRRMGHAGAIISGSSGTAQGKIKAMREAGITVVENLGEMGAIAKDAFASVLSMCRRNEEGAPIRSTLQPLVREPHGEAEPIRFPGFVAKAGKRG